MTLLNRLLLLVLLAVVPITAVETYNQFDLRRQREAEIHQRALRLVTVLDAEHTVLIEGIRRTLATLGETMALRERNVEGCRDLMRRLRIKYPEYLRIRVTDNSGVVRCATDTEAEGLLITSRLHYRLAVETNRFTVGEHMKERTSDTPVIPFAMRYVDKDGEPAGVVSALLDIGWLGGHLSRHPLPPNASIIVTDRKGVILAHVPERPDMIGSRMPAPYLQLITGPKKGTAELAGADNIVRVFGHSPVATEPDSLFIAVGIDKAHAMQPIDQAMARSMSLIAAVLLLTVLAAWWVGRHSIGKPVRTLIGTTRRWRMGEHGARARLTNGIAELAQLGRAFDEMADSLEERSRAIEAERSKYQAIVDTAMDAIVVIDSAGSIKSLNHTAERIFGYPGGEAIGRNIAALVPETEWLAHDGCIGREAEGLRKGGSRFPLELSIAEWRSDGQRFFTGIIRDVSERKTSELRLRESLALLEAILESTSDPIFAKGADGRLLAANTATAVALGCRHREEVLGRRDSDFLTPKAAMAVESVDRRIMETGEPATIEERIEHRALGGGRIYLTTKTPLRNLNGEILGLVGIARDITERMRREDALRMSEERFRSLVENAPNIMWLNHPDGRLKFFNAAWRSYTGHETEEDTRWNILHPEDQERIKNLRHHALATGEPYEYEMRLRRADGAYRWHLGRVTPVREDEKIVSWIGTSMDVHDIHRAREAAQEADRSKTRFLAAASHDLRQPMQSILLFTEALQPHIKDAAGRAKMTHLHNSLDALRGLLDSLLDVSRLDADIVTPQFEDFPVSEVIGPLSAAYAAVAREKGLGWQVSACAAQVCSDRVLLGRILRNLIENAVRYTAAGEISIDCTLWNGSLLIEVRDTGIGIPPEHRHRIFEEFHQVGNPERDRTQGLGLGLAIVRRLSRLLNHPITVTSEPGQGSTFTLSVPLAAVEAPPVQPPLPLVPPPASTDGRTKRFVVVVDDDPMVLMGLEAMLREWGYDVLTAGSTDEALKNLQEEHRRPDILLVDYRLREERVGTEAVLRIRAMFGTEVPGIIVTGEIGPEPQQDAAEHGLGLLHKPVSPRLLEVALTRQLQAAE